MPQAYGCTIPRHELHSERPMHCEIGGFIAACDCDTLEGILTVDYDSVYTGSFVC